jgi:hypothetical protein
MAHLERPHIGGIMAATLASYESSILHFRLPSSWKHASFRRADGVANSKEMISDYGIQCIAAYQLIRSSPTVRIP